MVETRQAGRGERNAAASPTVSPALPFGTTPDVSSSHSHPQRSEKKNEQQPPMLASAAGDAGERYRPADVVVVDDYSSYANRVADALSLLGASHLPSVAHAPAEMPGTRLALVVCEFDDNGRSGLDLVRTLRTVNIQPTFVITINAASLSAAKGAAPDGGFDTREGANGGSSSHRGPGAGNNETVDPLRFSRPHSVADRWATYVWRSCCTFKGDLKTLSEWAKCIGVSYSSLCETCRLLGVRPHDARDFTRVLGAIVTAARVGCPADVMLDVSDRRTLRRLLSRAAVDFGQHTPSALEFLGTQQFIPAHNPGVVALNVLMSNCDHRMCELPASEAV